MKIFLFILFLFPWVVSGQKNVYQDIFNGGVTGDYFNPVNFPVGGNFEIHIAPGSTIRKAYLFITVYFSPPQKLLYINNHGIILNSQNTYNNEYLVSTNSETRRMKTLMIDVSEIIVSTQNNYTISALTQSGEILDGLYCEYYLYVTYDNPTLEKICTNVFINNVQPDAHMLYSFNSLNPMDTTRNVGLAIHASNICDTILDGSFVKINNQPIGLIGGMEDNSLGSCSGVVGSFYYQNANLIGLRNDIGDSLVNGTDAIVNIEKYLLSASEFELTFDYQSNWGPKTNSINQLFLTYTTPCDVFSVSVPSDTTACKGTPLQLNVVGGLRYEWQPATGLSCSNCPNPIFTGTSSTLYSVRIWNNDSCSVVRPVRVTVASPPPKTSFTAVDTKCSTPNSGSIRIVETPEMSQFYAVNENGVTFINNGTSINNLPAGTYTVYYTNASGCKSPDTVLTIGYQKEAIANFTVLPTSGAAPLTVQITNTSLNATDYQWSLNGETITSLPTIFDTAGHYQLQLIAWNTNPNCADTITKTVFVYDSLIVQLPNVITPNNDGINDLFTLSTNLPLHAKIYIYNRWGNEVQLFDQQLNSGSHTIWDGKTNATQTVSDGVYFYKAIFTLSSAIADCAKQNCTTELSGFVTLVSGK